MRGGEGGQIIGCAPHSRGLSRSVGPSKFTESVKYNAYAVRVALLRISEACNRSVEAP
jgi:hypothetical protein